MRIPIRISALAAVAVIALAACTTDQTAPTVSASPAPPLTWSPTTSSVATIDADFTLTVLTAEEPVAARVAIPPDGEP